MQKKPSAFRVCTYSFSKHLQSKYYAQKPLDTGQCVLQDVVPASKTFLGLEANASQPVMCTQVSQGLKCRSGGGWVAQSVKHPTPDFSSCRDPTVCEFEPCIRLCTGSVEPGWDSVSLPLSPPPPSLPLFCSCPLSQNR